MKMAMTGSTTYIFTRLHGVTPQKTVMFLFCVGPLPLLQQLCFLSVFIPSVLYVSFVMVNRGMVWDVTAFYYIILWEVEISSTRPLNRHLKCNPFIIWSLR